MTVASEREPLGASVFVPPRCRCLRPPPLLQTFQPPTSQQLRRSAPFHTHTRQPEVTMNPKHALRVEGNKQNNASTHLGDLGQEVAPHSTTELAAAESVQITEEENTECKDVAVFMEPLHADLDHADADTLVDFGEWVNLPGDICHLILDHLGAFDILIFPLVCRPWADAYAEKRRLQPGAPTLLTSPSDDGWQILDESLRGLFFITNILSREVFPVEVEGMKNGSWMGGKDEWLVITPGGSQVQLLNPGTGRCIALPDRFIGSYDRVRLCRTPAETDDYVVIAISFYEVSYAMKGCEHWITLENPEVYCLSYSDAILHRGKIVAICRNGDMWSWDLDQGEGNPNLLLSSSINTKGWEQFDFILAPSLKDNILIVSPHGKDIPIRWRHGGPSHSKHWNFYVHGAVLHEVDTDAQSIEEVRDIGDRALFLGPNYPFYIHVSMPMGDLKKNYLYIAALSDHDVVAIDLSLEDVPGNVSFIDYSGPPDPEQVQMWYQPAFPSNVG